MNLKEFLARHSGCPVCNYPYLTTDFFSNRKQSISYEEDSVKVILELRSIDKMSASYKVGFYFSLKDNSFRVEFYTKYDEAKFEKSIPLSLINNFNNFAKNINRVRFARKCTSCHRFITGTNNIEIDYKNSKINDIELLCDSYGFVTQTESDYKIVVLNNLYKEQRSKIYYWRQNDGIINYEYAYPEGCSKLEVPIIPFVSEERTKERLNGLLLFA